MKWKDYKYILLEHDPALRNEDIELLMHWIEFHWLKLTFQI